MKLTTGYEFQGYYITEYLDVIFDEILVGLGFGKSIISSFDNMLSSLTGTEATAMIEKLNAVKFELRDRVIAKATQLGANALIGVDFESSKLGDLIMVSMTATAVKIDKIVSPLPVTQQDQASEAERLKKERLENEKHERLNYVLAHANEFNPHLFIKTVEGLNTTKEMVNYIKQVAVSKPELITDELLQEMDKYVRMERLYGRGSGNDSVIIALKNHFGIH